MFKAKWFLVAVASLVVMGPMGLSQGVVPNAVVNGDFELHAPDEGDEMLEGSPLDECIGVGHQVFWGSQTPQGKAAQSVEASADADPDEGSVDASASVSSSSAQEGAQMLVDDPKHETVFLVGYGHCVHSEEEGADVAWINPSHQASNPALAWSATPVDEGGSVWFGDNDDDGDREAVVLADDSLQNHNMWQSWLSSNQAFTANFQTFEFDVEAGAIADNAAVILSLSATPMAVQSPWVGLWLDCQLRFSADQLQDSLDDDQDRVVASPLEATFTSRHADCDDLETAWKDTETEEEKREVLGQLRIGQLSFWSFNHAEQDEACSCAIQIDNVAITHATSVPEEIAAGNVNVQPSPP